MLVQTTYSEKRLKSSFKTEDKTNRASTRYYIQAEVCQLQFVKQKSHQRYFIAHQPFTKL